MAVDLRAVSTSIFPMLEKVKPHLRFDQHQIDEKYNEIMLDIFVGESFTLRALSQSDTFAETSIISFTVRRIQ
jgi:hypothetical protein